MTDFHQQIIFIVILTLFILSTGGNVGNGGPPFVLNYSIRENKPGPQLIGNLTGDVLNLNKIYNFIKLPSDQIHLQFSWAEDNFLTAKWFQLSENGLLILPQGEYYDRENKELCPFPQQECMVKLEIYLGLKTCFNISISNLIPTVCQEFPKIITVTVNISDENDNAPEFASEIEKMGEYVVNFFESDQIGSFHVIPAAKDSDLGQNAQIYYKKAKEYAISSKKLHNSDNDLITESTQYFRLDELRSPDNLNKINGLKLVLIRPIDREKIQTIKVEINATDGGTPQKSSLARIRVDILDVNEHAPIFKNSSYFINLSESFPTYTEFLRVEAVDQDSDLNGNIKYSITDTNAPDSVNINENSGGLMLSKILDYESVKSIRLLVLATDQGITTKLTGMKLIQT